MQTTQDEITIKAEELRRAKHREYGAAYRAAHREELRASKQKWRKEHPEKDKLYQKKFWEVKALVEIIAAEIGADPASDEVKAKARELYAKRMQEHDAEIKANA